MECRGGTVVECLPGERFRVESNDECCVVYWRKLQKLLLPREDAAAEIQVAAAPKPGLEARIAPEAAVAEGRMHSVIEKIERLYKGGSDEDEYDDQSDNATAGAPDVEQYDTDDSFIDDCELDEYFLVDKSKTKHTGFFVNQGALERLTEPSEPERTEVKAYKKRKKVVNGEGSGRAVEAPASKKPRPSMRNVEVQGSTKRSGVLKSCKIKNDSNGLSEPKEPLAERNNALAVDHTAVNRSEETALTKTPPKECSPGKRGPKGTVLDRAIQDLEKGVAELCPPVSDNQESENKCRRILPREVKARLAKVARLAQKQDKISDEFLQGLMKILGHVMQLKTLKKHMKEMVELGLSAQKEKESKLEYMKQEIVDMVKARISSNQAPEGEEARFPDCEGRYKWDNATEDKICDLYELYVEGMDEHRAAPTKRFYAEIAELWPQGWMESNGIKCAVTRAKERRKGAMKQARIEQRKRSKNQNVSQTKTVKSCAGRGKSENVSPRKHTEQQQLQQDVKKVDLDPESQGGSVCGLALREKNEEGKESGGGVGSRGGGAVDVAVEGELLAVVTAEGGRDEALPNSLRKIKKKLSKAANKLQSSFCHASQSSSFMFAINKEPERMMLEPC